MIASKKKNVLILIPHLYGGGAERVASDLANFLYDKYNIFIVTFEKWEDKKYDYEVKSNITCLGITGDNSKFKKIFNLFNRIRFVKKFKKDNKIEVSISFLDNANLVNSLAKSKDIVITSFRSLLSVRNSGLLYKFAIKIIGKKSDCIVTLSEMVRQDLINHFSLDESKIKTIYNSCDIKKINNHSGNNNNNFVDIFNDKDKKYIVTMGRLMHPKGHWHLLKSFKLVYDFNKNVKLLIIGEGILENDLKKLAKLLRIEKNVCFLGFISNPFEIIKNSDLFVFTSLYEGLGNAIIEALACGKTVVSTDCKAGPREILDPSSPLSLTTKKVDYCEYGILVKPYPINEKMDFTNNINENEKNYAKVIIDVLENKKVVEKYESIAKLRANDFSQDIIMSEWIKLIEN